MIPAPIPPNGISISAEKDIIKLLKKNYISIGIVLSSIIFFKNINKFIQLL